MGERDGGGSTGAGGARHGDRGRKSPRTPASSGRGGRGAAARDRRGEGGRDRSRRGQGSRTADERSPAGTPGQSRRVGARDSRGATAPALPDDVQAAELDREVRAELASLAAANADTVARHLVMAGRLLDEDPELAYRHAVAARERAGRVGAVREAAGLTAYHAGHYAEALAELRAARRITGDQSLLPVMADCERGLGRPERALEIAASPQAAGLDPAARVELLIVASGARRDLGQPEAAALMLRGPWLRPDRRRPWSARLFYAYAAALAEAGRTVEALEWFGHALEADDEDETDAAERIVQLGASAD